MFNLNLDKVVDAINRLAAAIEEITVTLKNQYKNPPKDVKVT